MTTTEYIEMSNSDLLALYDQQRRNADGEAAGSDPAGVPSKQSVAPLRRIIDRPQQLRETLECGHTINRPCGLGEDLMRPSRAKKRRCFLCTGGA